MAITLLFYSSENFHSYKVANVFLLQNITVCHLFWRTLKIHFGYLIFEHVVIP